MADALSAPLVRERSATSATADILLAVVALLAGSLTIADRALVLRLFSFEWVDEDQAVLWYMARDFAAGHLREPCFPGQAYGTAFEALVAAPLVRLGLGLNVALPLAAAALSLSPFLLWAGLAWREASHRTAIAILCLPLLLPSAHAVIASMPRGFAPGLFAGSLGLVLLLASRGGWLCVGGLLAVLAVSSNESSLLLVLPGLLLFGLEHRCHRRELLLTGLGMAAGVILHALSRAFYRWHPTYSLHPAPKHELSLRVMFDGLQHVGRFLSDVSPFGSVLLLALLVLGLVGTLVAARARHHAAVGGLIVASTVAALGLGKVHDGGHSVFFAWPRAFLALPLALALLLVLVGRVQRPLLDARLSAAVLLVVSVASFVVHARRLERDVFSLGADSGGAVQKSRVSDVTANCEALEQLALRGEASLIAFEQDRVLAYGCGALHYGRLETLFGPYERRTWRLEEESIVPRDRFVFMAADGMPCDRFAGLRVRCSLLDQKRRAALVELDDQPVLPLLRRSRSAVRPF